MMNSSRAPDGCGEAHRTDTACRPNVALARSVARLGAAEANKQRAPDPFEELKVPDGLDVSTIDDAVTTGRGGGGGPIRPAILEPYRSWIREPAGTFVSESATSTAVTRASPCTGPS